MVGSIMGNNGRAIQNNYRYNICPVTAVGIPIVMVENKNDIHGGLKSAPVFWVFALQNVVF